MFDLDTTIAEWRRQIQAAGITAPGLQDELESHLRENVESLLASGMTETQSFELARRRLGDSGRLRAEFDKLAAARPVSTSAWLWAGAMLALMALLSRGLFAKKLNLLLFAHVFSLTAGYTTAFVTGGFGIYIVCRRWFGAWPAFGRSGSVRAIALFSRLSAVLVAMGLVLGMIWSKQHFGRYWMSDPRAVGTWCATVWLIALCLAQRFGRDRISIPLGIGGSVIVSLAWFGAAILAHRPAMNGYGNLWPLAVFLGIHLCFLVMSLWPREQMTEAS